jgi:isopenicillin-N N-acyltransferase like protein
VDGCSALAYKDPKTGKQLLAQNWDWYGNQLENVIVLDVTLLDGTRLVTITEAGIVGKVGFNGDCVGVTLNAIKTAGLPLDYSKLPIHLAIRYIVLESPNAAEAINRLMRIGVASTVHFLIADAVSAYGIEVSPRGSGIITPDPEGFVLHTNHWISSPALVESVIWLVDTDARLKRLETLKSTINSAEDIWDVLADEEGWPGSICRGVSNGREAEMDLETLFGVVMDLEFGMAEMVHGRPKTGSPKVPLPRSGPLGNVGADVKRQSSG